jgi:hypothetical protein
MKGKLVKLHVTYKDYENTSVGLTAAARATTATATATTSSDPNS